MNLLLELGVEFLIACVRKESKNEILKLRYLGINIDTALVFARQSPSRVTGWRAVGSLSPRGQRLSELTAKLANYERTDKISVGLSPGRPALLSVRCGGGSRAIYETSKKSSPNLSLFLRTELN